MAFLGDVQQRWATRANHKGTGTNCKLSSQPGIGHHTYGRFFISGDFSIFFSKRVLLVANCIKSCLPKLSYHKSCI